MKNIYTVDFSHVIAVKNKKDGKQKQKQWITSTTTKKLNKSASPMSDTDYRMPMCRISASRLTPYRRVQDARAVQSHSPPTECVWLNHSSRWIPLREHKENWSSGLDMSVWNNDLDLNLMIPRSDHEEYLLVLNPHKHRNIKDKFSFSF